MKVIIEVDFKKVAGKEIPIGDKNVERSMGKAVEKLCESIKKFYADYKIEVDVHSKLENE